MVIALRQRLRQPLLGFDGRQLRINRPQVVQQPEQRTNVRRLRIVMLQALQGGLQPHQDG